MKNIKITEKELENNEFLIVENLKKYLEKEIKNKKIKNISKNELQVQASFLVKIKFIDIDKAIIEIKSNWTYNKSGKDKELELENETKWQSVRDFGDEIIILFSKKCLPFLKLIL